MMRVHITAALAASLLFAAGCKKEQPAPGEAPKVEEKKAEARTKPQVEDEAPAQDQGDAPEVKLTADHVEKYAKYSEAFTPVALKYAADTQAAGKKGTTGIAELGDLKAKFEAEEAALRKTHGLTEAETKELNEAVGSVVDMRRMWKQGGGDKMIDDMKAAQAKVPPEQKAEFDEQLKNIERGLKKMRDAEEARAEYGNEVVDAIVKHEDAFATQREQVLKAALGAAR